MGVLDSQLLLDLQGEASQENVVRSPQLGYASLLCMGRSFEIAKNPQLCSPPASTCKLLQPSNWFCNHFIGLQYSVWL